MRVLFEVCQLMSNGIVTLFVSHSVSTLTTIRSYSATFQMPFVTSNMAVNASRAQPDMGYELYLRPHYSRAIVDLVRHYGWREIWCLYSSDEGLCTCPVIGFTAAYFPVFTLFAFVSVQS